jgi:hypothetical protein
MDQLPHNHNPEEQPTDATQEISLGEMFAGDDRTSTNESPVELTDADPATGEGADYDSGPDHRTRNKVLIGAGAVVTAAALFLAGKAFGGGEATPAASPTGVGQETPQPSATTPDTPATTEQTPAPSSTSPTSLPAHTETKSIPVGVPTTPGATQPETKPAGTPAPSESAPATDPSSFENKTYPDAKYVSYYSKQVIPDSKLKGEALVKSLQIRGANPEEAFQNYHLTLEKWMNIGNDASYEYVINYNNDLTIPGEKNVGGTVWVNQMGLKYNPAFVDAVFGPYKSNPELSENVANLQEASTLIHQNFADSLHNPEDPGDPNKENFYGGFVVKLHQIKKVGAGEYNYVFDSYGIDNGDMNWAGIRREKAGEPAKTDIDTPGNLRLNKSVTLKQDGDVWYVSGLK